jgi:hypothetical protein
MHQIHLKVTLLKPLLRGQRPLRNIPLTTQDPSTVVRSISLSSTFTALAKMPVEDPSVVLIPPEIAGDRLMTDAHRGVAPKHQGNLLRRPIQLKEAADQSPLFRAELGLFPGPATPTIGMLLGDVWEVSVDMQIPADFPANGCPMPAELLGYLGLRKALP